MSEPDIKELLKENERLKQQLNYHHHMVHKTRERFLLCNLLLKFIKYNFKLGSIIKPFIFGSSVRKFFERMLLLNNNQQSVNDYWNSDIDIMCCGDKKLSDIKKKEISIQMDLLFEIIKTKIQQDHPIQIGSWIIINVKNVTAEKKFEHYSFNKRPLVDIPHLKLILKRVDSEPLYKSDDVLVDLLGWKPDDVLFKLGDYSVNMLRMSESNICSVDNDSDFTLQNILSDIYSSKTISNLNIEELNIKNKPELIKNLGWFLQNRHNKICDSYYIEPLGYFILRDNTVQVTFEDDKKSTFIPIPELLECCNERKLIFDIYGSYNKKYTFMPFNKYIDDYLKLVKSTSLTNIEHFINGLKFIQTGGGYRSLLPFPEDIVQDVSLLEMKDEIKEEKEYKKIRKIKVKQIESDEESVKEKEVIKKKSIGKHKKNKKERHIVVSSESESSNNETSDDDIFHLEE